MKLKKTAKYMLGALALWFVGHSAYIIWDGTRDAGGTADVAVILGNTVNRDGTLSARLEARLAKGLELYRAGRAGKLLVSGGLGKEGFWEGDKMRDYYRAHGVPDSVIVVDNKGDNTEATVRNTVRLRDSLHYRSLLIVSQYFHLTRTKRLFRKYGFAHVAGCAPDYFEARDLYSIAREFVAFYAP